MSSLEEFGRTADGETVNRVRIAGGGLDAYVMNWGAVVQDLRLDGHRPPLVLGFERFEDYPAHSPFFGATVGRYANRIRDGHALIDGRALSLDRNFLGRHLLHGGGTGIGRRVWSIAEHSADAVTLTLRDPDGAMGFPGTVDIACTYRLSDGALVATMEATTDAPTLCNLAHHSYFNLDDGGAGTILDHRLTIDAGAWLPVDDELIPTGHVVPVDDTPFDFRSARPVRNEGPGGQTAYDHNWCLAAARRPLARAARFEGARSGVAMEVWSTEPGLQFYAGGRVARSVPGLEGIAYANHAGACFEPQVWPDSPNRPYFPQALLRPGETYRQVTEYRFSRN